MRAVLFGAVQFSGKCLERFLIGWPGLEVVGVVTKRESVFHSDFLNLEPIARAAKIPVHFSMGRAAEENDLVSWLDALSPDVIFVLGWSHLLSARVVKTAAAGCIGYHPAMLPRNRGRHPLIWTLVLGLREAGSTFFWLGSGVDNGDIINQRAVAVTDDDDAASLYSKVEAQALEQLNEFIPALISGQRSGVPQEPTQANEWRKRVPGDGEIDWRMSARSIRNLVRALTKPYPGATVRIGLNRFPVWRAEFSSLGSDTDEPGKVLGHGADGEFVVKCGEGALLVARHEISPAPKKGDYL
ncbi:MAG: formyl transferase [Bdellovibrionales bacterium]|nr:formyl transferase [Bdellovibrionales bacterium]